MTAATVEERLTTLETRLDLLQRLLDDRAPRQTATKQKRGWQAIVGTFADDALYEEAMRLGREWRESQHEQPEEPASLDDGGKEKCDGTTRAD